MPIRQKVLSPLALMTCAQKWPNGRAFGKIGFEVCLGTHHPKASNLTTLGQNAEQKGPDSLRQALIGWA